MGSTGQQEEKTVLLVEDEEALRNLLQLILAQHGYGVLEADNGEKALWIAGQHGGPIHLLITDALLPRLNGYELAQRLRSEHPEMKVLYVSGYLAGDLIERCHTDPGCLFMQKPFTPAEFISKVKEALRPEKRAGRAG